MELIQVATGARIWEWAAEVRWRRGCQSLGGQGTEMPTCLRLFMCTVKIFKMMPRCGTQSLQIMRKLVDSKNKEGLTKVPPKDIKLGCSHYRIRIFYFILKHFQTYWKMVRIAKLLIFCHICILLHALSLHTHIIIHHFFSLLYSRKSS